MSDARKVAPEKWKTVIRHPIKRKTKNVPNAVTLAAMDAAEKNEDMYGPFDSVEEFRAGIDSII
jgi:hypothetical protein